MWSHHKWTCMNGMYSVHRALCMRTLYIIVSKIFFTLLSTFIIQLTGYICARSTRLNSRSYNSSKEYRHQCQPTIASIDQIILIWFGMCFRLTFVLSLRFLFHFLLKYTNFFLYHQLRTDDTRFLTPKTKSQWNSVRSNPPVGLNAMKM